jgi:hypothetical protein
LYDRQRLTASKTENLRSAVASWAVWSDFTSHPQQTGKTLPVVPKKSTGRGGG